MVKLEWGTKRACLGCAARFYDLRRTPVVCPKCGEVYETQSSNKRSRARGNSEGTQLGAPVDDPSLLGIDLSETLVDGISGDDIIEDTSDLGDELDDMAEVIDHADEVEER